MLTFLLPVTLVGQTHFVSYNTQDNHPVLPGKESDILLIFDVAPGYHIQADEDQLLNKNMIPASLILESIQGLNVCQIGFSKPKALVLGAQERLQVFDKSFTVRVEAEISETLLPGIYPIRGKLYYQACDNQKCFFPRGLAFEAQVEVRESIGMNDAVGFQ